MSKTNEKGLVRVTKALNDKGTLVPPDQVDQIIDDNTHDWYCSPFIYSADVVQHWNENDQSIKNYNGKVYTSTLYWDLDYKEDFEVVREAACQLLTSINSLGMIDATEVFFSGNKGVHILLHTDEQFNPKETKEVCKGIAEAAGIDAKSKVLDSSVYNANRIFRIVNTKHPESGLYKIQLDFDEIENLSEKEIRDLAKSPSQVVKAVPVKNTTLKKTFVTAPVKSNVIKLATPLPFDTEPVKYERMGRGKKRCIHALEQGDIGPGERENATMCLSTQYRSQGVDKEQAFSLIHLALTRREQRFGPQNPWSDADIYRCLDQVYADSWRGGVYSCKTYEWLAAKCSKDGVPCSLEHNDPIPHVSNVDGFCEDYIKYIAESKRAFPKTGIDWLDAKIRIRPKNFSIINGANGSGKTSLVIQLLEEFNKQKICTIFFSFDMANSSLFEKLGARYTKYTSKEIEDAFLNAEMHIIDQVLIAIKSNFPYTFFDFTSLATSSYIDKVIREVNNAIAKDGDGKHIDVAIIDYAGRLTGSDGNAYANATANALAANDIAKRNNAHLLYISQISRENGDHTSPLRTSRVSKDSGAWEENATFIINCWRPFGDGLAGLDDYLHLYISKNRGGGLGEKAFWWDGAKGDISEMNEEEYKKYVSLCESEDKPTPPKWVPNNHAKIKAKREMLYADSPATIIEAKDGRSKTIEIPKKLSNTKDS